MDEKPADSARVQRIVRAPVDCTAQRSPFQLLGPGVELVYGFFKSDARERSRVERHPRRAARKVVF
jgi:hypothetical protein